MAMKIPSGNPFGVDPSVRSVEGLVTPKANAKYAQAKYSEFQKKVDEWNAEQDQTAANDLINQIENESDRQKIDPNEGWANQLGKNAAQRESGKTLAEEQQEKLKTFYNSLNVGMYSPAVRKKVQTYFDAKLVYLNRDINQHVIKQTEVYNTSVKNENMRIAMNDVQSDDVERVRGAFMTIKDQTDNEAKRLGIVPDYTKNLGQLFETRALYLMDKGQFDVVDNELNQAEKYMSSASRRRLSRLNKKMRENRANAIAETGVAAQMDVEFSDVNIAKEVYKDTTGKNIDENVLNEAIEDADGDVVSALQTVTQSGLSEMDKSLDPKVAEERAVNAAKSLSARIDQVRHMSVDDVALHVKKKYPDIPAENALKASRKFVLNREMRYKQEQADRDEQARMVFQGIRSGASFDDIPSSGTNKLKKSTKEALQKFSQRMAVGSLQDDLSLTYDLKTNPKKLSGMSDEEFVSLACRMKPDTFDFLSMVRDEIKSGKRSKDPKFHMAPMIRDAMTAQGIKVGSSSSSKQMAGLVFEVLEEALEFEAHKAGRALTQDEVNKIVGEMVKTNFVFPDDWYGYNDTISGKEMLSGKSVDMNDDVEKLLNAGLIAQGIYEPTDVNRTRSFAYINFMPQRPIEGAEQMVKFLETSNKKVYNQIVAEAKAKGITDIDPSRFVRAALKKMSAYKQQ